MTGPTPLSVCMTVYLHMISGGMFSLVLCIVISSGFSVLGGPTVSDKDFARRCMPPAALKLGWSCPNMLITDTVAFPCELLKNNSTGQNLHKQKSTVWTTNMVIRVIWAIITGFYRLSGARR